MPYRSTSELPDSVKDNLPVHAQEIFKEAFNSATEEYDKEETAYKVAWSAVKQKYGKNKDGEWVKK
ncbi:cation transporter [Aneurinibacillus migulanus]|uniref:Cation transport regulator n=1 Tax=Aneurinibacillus migulanus TaxID=47500 RepID=A0A0D1VZS2_ANEMI|nr:ChaB family protein [Aneurinibacillus migulanus]KIV51303.1 cation transporter [Aneurinibacillus migulanus]KIV51670.1 cation transporter [Aneurinibacillus migulanus]KON94775.1 cation transporter [Aneurinibacillus migulanus]KPD08375.1 cation transporter [Aneurinibacillus migulanus]MCP1354706.1 ChaB family protein [Aneurinibacillus migulanus]